MNHREILLNSIVHENLTLDLASFRDNVFVEISDGENSLSRNFIFEGGKKVKIDVSTLISGTYKLKIESSKKSIALAFHKT